MNKRLHSLIIHINQIGFCQTISYLLQRSFKRKGKLIKIKIRDLSQPIYLRNKSYDTNIFYQIFIGEEVNFCLGTAPAVIIDCGANIGLSTLYFKRKYPFSKIYSIEPELSNFRMLEKNTNSYNNIKQINAAIWYKSGTINLVDNGEGHASFITTDDDNSKNIIGQIPTISIEDLKAIHLLDSIDLLKIDIEGSEFDIFSRNIDLWVNNIQCLAIEIHESLRPGTTKIINKSLETYQKKRVGEYTVYTQQKVF